jgi:glutathione S-transferase
VVLHIGNKNYSSWSLRPWVLMRERGIAFDERLVPFKTSAYTDFSPSGKVPCLHDGDVVVWDSLAIAEYLAETDPGVWPRDRLARAWARSAAAEMHSGFTELRSKCSMSCGIRVRIEAGPALLRDIARIDALWGDGLARFGGPFLAGAAFTAVDAFYAPVAFRIQTYGLSLRNQGYADRLLALPSMQEWYAAALAEPFRDEPHEVELKALGQWTADLRTAG